MLIVATGTPAINQSLSEIACRTVADELVKIGVNRDKIKTAAHGGVNDLESYLIQPSCYCTGYRIIFWNRLKKKVFGPGKHLVFIAYYQIYSLPIKISEKFGGLCKSIIFALAYNKGV